MKQDNQSQNKKSNNDKPNNKKTVLVVGGGPAGVQAALRAHELGAKVTLLEANKLGGTAFNEGPAPVRTLARAARLRTDTALYSQFGLQGDTPSVDFKAAIDNANRVAAHANKIWHLTEVVKQQGIEVIDEVGPAHFVNNNTLEIADGRQFSADKIILTVGGKPKKLSIPGNELALSFHDLWSMTELPERVTVVGGSATGCQLASILIDFGAQVDIIEFADRLSPPSDADISRKLEQAFKSRGMNVLTSTGCESISKENGQLKVTYKHDEQVDSLMTDAVFLMVGWPADLEGLNLEATDIKVNGPYIEVDDYLQTNVEGVYVAGDANGVSMFVQSAAHQARVATQNALSDTAEKYAPRAIATGSFTEPEYASVGMTQAQAEEDHECIVEIIDYENLPRAVMDGRTDGFCKIIIDKQTQQLLGAHVLGSYSAEVIQVAATCLATKMTVNEIANLELAFPTFTEALGMAAQRICRNLRMEDEKIEE
ncbi:NAD(P)/FAD-dependent oxidoreductase [Psychrobacter sp. TAE2020]|uniref:dihydrolipoyl dehydrogenase family protein n=1 Tax=Psychrobacter sp. TAE2020 TaxID=2846762 RepID=UPI001C1249E3|nr:NAD(P)/FAD-dependent oxidoreductase [Psychrobacter sp. TAE2020]MBU5617115.1 NAD(P)/FAD-dependent oxidoreductase [Psychrobacter sp. TAE2020]